MLLILQQIHKIKYIEFVGGKRVNKKDDIIFIYDENAENIEDKILKIFKKYLEEKIE